MHTLHFAAHKPIHHNICQSSCRVNRIINKYPPVNDHGAVISPVASKYLALSLPHTHSRSHRFPIHHTALSEAASLTIRPDITGWTSLYSVCVSETEIPLILLSTSRWQFKATPSHLWIAVSSHRWTECTGHH